MPAPCRRTRRPIRTNRARASTSPHPRACSGAAGSRRRAVRHSTARARATLRGVGRRASTQSLARGALATVWPAALSRMPSEQQALAMLAGETERPFVRFSAPPSSRRAIRVRPQSRRRGTGRWRSRSRPARRGRARSHLACGARRASAAAAHGRDRDRVRSGRRRAARPIRARRSNTRPATQPTGRPSRRATQPRYSGVSVDRQASSDRCVCPGTSAHAAST